MRWILAHLGILFAVWLSGSQYCVYAQADSPPDLQSLTPCPASDARDEESRGPGISIGEVTFSGSFQMPISDQEQIGNSIKEKTHGTSLEEVTDEALERARAGWQDRGYFKVKVSVEARALTSMAASQSLSLSVRVDEGARYNLSRIAFKNNKAISNRDLLRGLFPIADGNILSREKIATGLENLRKAYGELGYINFTSVPDTKFDDENRRTSLVIDIDEGKQFRVSSVDVLGLDETSRQEILNDFPIGQVYNQRFFVLLLEKYYSILRIPADDPWRT